MRNRQLRALELAWGAAITAEWAHFVALGVFAYQEDGTLGVGIVGFIRLLPAAAIAPFAASLGDRFPRERFLAGVCLLGTVAMSASAAAYSLGPFPYVIYALAAVAAIASTLFRPANQALLPSLASTPDELVAANAFSSTLESLGTFAGPLVGGAVVALANAGWVFGAASVMFSLATVLVTSITVVGRRLEARDPGRAQVLGGFRIIAREAGPRLVIALMIAQTFVRGALNTLIVVVAFRILHAGAGWVGLLSAAVGAGGLVGAFAAVGVAGRRLARPFALALIAWGLPIALLAGVSYGLVAFLLVAVIGAANSIEDVAGFTLLQRIVDDTVLARVLGAVWGLAAAGLAVGSIAASLLVDAAGDKAALVAIGAFLPVSTLLVYARLTSLDRTAVAPPEFGYIAGVAMFEPLPIATKEQLARRLERIELPAGVDVVTAGEAGDRFYVVGEGELDVIPTGGVATAGDSFGEIALLRDVPRTATVRTRTPSVLFALVRDDFLAAVTGHEAVHAAAERVVVERLGVPAAG
jgi:MFS family permease